MSDLPESQGRAKAIKRRGLSALVLGGSGFIGGHLLRHLSRRPEFSEIYGFCSGDWDPKTAPGVSSVRGAIDKSALSRSATPDVVFWAIGGSSVSASLQNPALDFERSIPPLSALLDQLQGPWQRARLIFLSSAAVYGMSGSEATSVSNPLTPISPYGAHKLLSEEMIRSAPGGVGSRYTIVRPFSVYGPGLRRQLFWDAIRKCEHGNFLFQGTGQEMRDWLYIDDLIALLADVAVMPERFPQIMNAGSGLGITVSDALGSLFSTLGTAAIPQFAGDARAGDPARLVANLAEQQPFEGYFRTSLEAGLGQYIAWQAADHK